MREVEARAEANLKNSALHVFEASLSLLRERFGAHCEVEDAGKNAIFVKAHSGGLAVRRLDLAFRPGVDDYI